MKKSIVFYLLFFSIFVLLTGCADNVTPAPVVNGWYQKNAASDFYVVQSDDTIYSIAFAFGLDYRALAAVNHLQPPYVIHRGQRLRMTHEPAGQYHAVFENQRAVRGTHERTPSGTTAAQRPSVSRHASGATMLIDSDTHTPTPTPTPTPTHTLWHRPANGPIIHTFSRTPTGHPGISIAGKLGEPVRATRSGVVVYSGDGIRGYGNLIIIKHNDAYLSAYAFNQENLVRVGDRVQAGTVIAHMGRDDAGRAMLYFEIRRNGVPVDPLSMISGR